LNSVILRSLLAGPIRAVPYQQFGTDKVVLRAEFEVTLTSGLPAVIGESIRQNGIETVEGITLVRRPLVVDLFEMSNVPLHAVEAHDLRETGMSLSKVGAALGISKRLADWATRMGAAMAARGLTDPFVPADGTARAGFSVEPAARSPRRRPRSTPGDVRTGSLVNQESIRMRLKSERDGSSLSRPSSKIIDTAANGRHAKPGWRICSPRSHCIWGPAGASTQQSPPAALSTQHRAAARHFRL